MWDPYSSWRGWAWPLALGAQNLTPSGPPRSPPHRIVFYSFNTEDHTNILHLKQVSHWFYLTPYWAQGPQNQKTMSQMGCSRIRWCWGSPGMDSGLYPTWPVPLTRMGTFSIMLARCQLHRTLTSHTLHILINLGSTKALSCSPNTVIILCKQWQAN